MNELAPEFHKIWESRNASADAWLRMRQIAALETFEQQGFPSKSQEDWRYTDLRKLAESYPQWLRNDTAASTSTATDTLDLDDAIRVCFVDGILRPDMSDTLPEGVIAGSVNELATTNRALLERFWGSQASDQDSGLISLNSAFANACTAITLPRNIRLSRPLYIHFFGSIEHISTQPRLFIDLGENAAATVIEHYSGSAPQIVNAVTEISCGADSVLQYFKVQEEAPHSWHTAAQYARLDRNASITTAHIDLGAELSRNDLKIFLDGEHARADCKGVFMADAKRHVESRITVNHAAPHTVSRERFRGILADESKGVFNGRIHVDQCAQKTLAELTNRNLLLNEGAEINSKPELEIYADDVKCAHGSTTGQLDKTALFYLLSRGISPEEARNLLVLAFAAELVDSLGIEALSSRVRQALRTLGIDS